MKFRFSLRTLLIAITLTCLVIFSYLNWPRRQVPGAPNLIGTVVDSNGNPLAYAYVWVSRGSGDLRGETDKRGRFRFESAELTDPPLPSGMPGNWSRDTSAEPLSAEPFQDEFSDEFADEFVFFRVAHETHYYSKWFHEPKETQHVNMIKDFDHVFELEMKLGGVVSGRLTTESGVPFANAEVKLICQSKPDFVRWYATDSTGRFKTDALPPRSFDVGIDYSYGIRFKLIDDYDAEMFLHSPDAPTYFGFMRFGQVQIEVGQTVKFEREISLDNWMKFEEVPWKESKSFLLKRLPRNAE